MIDETFDILNQIPQPQQQQQQQEGQVATKTTKNWKFEFQFRAERMIRSPPPSSMINKHEGRQTRIDKEPPKDKINLNESDFGNRTSSNPTTPTTPTQIRHNYNDPNIYYVSRDFFAATPEHLSVFMDDELELLEELPGGAWTRVRERDSRQVGLIPTEILESGAERLAKENKSSNQDSIRIMSCKNASSSSASSFSISKKRKEKVKSVSFCASDPEIVHYPADGTNDHSIFPFTLEDDLSEAIAGTEATCCDSACSVDEDDEFPTAFPIPNQENENAPMIGEEKPAGFLKRLFKKKPSAVQETILANLKDFEKYPDHLVRVYTGNHDSLLHGYKTFIVDESLTFGEFSQMVLSTFDLENDGYFYELNLVNHLTAEVVPLDLDFTVEQVIELTKREGIVFFSQMPHELRKAQKKAIKSLQRAPTNERNKSTDYVTPFKFVLNRTFTSSENVPIFMHANLTYAPPPKETLNNEANLVITSMFPESERQKFALEGSSSGKNKTKKWLTNLKKPFGNKSSNASKDDALHMQLLRRLQVSTRDPLHVLIDRFLETLNVPRNLPGIAFEAFLPAIHDAIELPLPITMPIGDVLKIRPKLDQSQQIITIRPVII